MRGRTGARAWGRGHCVRMPWGVTTITRGRLVAAFEAVSQTVRASEPRAMSQLTKLPTRKYSVTSSMPAGPPE
ncbi:hypothetical protein GCM10009721_26340 [Terrabacter tumescens]|uniref:Uncharacterized protein n=1 Tax=Terrabacter tumescens TaxID=60443 RepID=A0ABQ2I1U9_9MICO|nr:hypothetical protein GCM10009721_26340 [Terrabacter tumescens]